VKHATPARITPRLSSRPYSRWHSLYIALVRGARTLVLSSSHRIAQPRAQKNESLYSARMNWGLFEALPDESVTVVTVL
jgi:hypothetical protein